MTSPTVALVGTTASGKSSLAMSVALRLADVELVCVDSMTVYRGMDIATAKPTRAERAAVVHHMLDLVEPTAECTVREFQSRATAVRADIARRRKRALLVGGTGLYLRAVVDALDIPARYPALAEELEDEALRPGGVQALHARLAALDPLAASRTTDTNRRRVVRALEVTLGSGRPFSSFGPGLGSYPPTDVVLLGLPFLPEVVDRRIEERFARWMDDGLADEVRRLATRPGGLSRTARQALGYKELLAHVECGAPLAECVAEAVRRTRAFARRQWSWFRRDPRIRWIGADEDAEDLLVAALEGDVEVPDAAGAHGRGRAGGRLVTMVQAAARRTSRPAGRGPVARTGFPMVKLEAAGNDFLVVLDVDVDVDVVVGAPDVGPASGTGPLLGAGARLLTPAQVRAVCDRRRGVGADGLILGRRGGPGTDLEMVLHNADGSEAEMSGNGIRCLVHAAVLAGIVPSGRVRVATATGVRTVAYRPGADGSAWARVDMGAVRLGREVESPLPRTRARLADVGNPHLVVIGELGSDAGTGAGVGGGRSSDVGNGLDLADLGLADLGSLSAAAARLAGETVNLEVVRPGRGGADFELRVFERGVGETLACGTGTCAAAAVARAWGMAGDDVTVDNPGGRLEVHFGTGTGTRVRTGTGTAAGTRVGTRAGAEAGTRGSAEAGRGIDVHEGAATTGHPGGAYETVDGVELGGPVRRIAYVEVDPFLLDPASPCHEGR